MRRGNAKNNAIWRGSRQVRRAKKISSLKTEDDKTQFEHELAVELEAYNERRVIDLTGQEAAKELLIRLYFMGYGLESIGGKLSRVAWLTMSKPPRKRDWQDAAKHRNDAMYGEPERMPETHIEKLYEDDEYELVKSLMNRAEMKIDTRVANREKALAKGKDGMSEFRHEDPFLDRAHSIGLVYKLIIGDVLVRRALENVAQMQELHAEISQKWLDWRNEDVARSKVVKVVLTIPRYRQRKRFEDELRVAKANLNQAEAEYKAAWQGLGKDLDAAYSQDVHGKHYHLQLGVAYRQRMEGFYQKFFGRMWPYNIPARNSGNMQKSGDVTQLSPRQNELERISKLRICLGMEI